MTKLVTLTCVFIMIIYLKNAVTLASEIEEKRKEKDDKYSKLWFGPRIGRRKRNPNEEIGSFDNNDVQNLVDFIRKNPWTIFVLSTGQTDSSKSGKEIAKDSREEYVEVTPRFSPYVPRLGRAVPIY